MHIFTCISKKNILIYMCDNNVPVTLQVTFEFKDFPEVESLLKSNHKSSYGTGCHIFIETLIFIILVNFRTFCDPPFISMVQNY